MIEPLTEWLWRPRPPRIRLHTSTLLGLLPGRPQVVITDSDNAIGGAVATEGDQVTIVRNGAIVSRDRHAFLAEVEDTYGEDVADEVMLAMLPIDERLHVEQHRNREITKRMRELEDED
jgi:hypothetical protein